MVFRPMEPRGVGDGTGAEERRRGVLWWVEAGLRGGWRARLR